MPGAGGTTGYHLHFEVRITNNEDQGMKLKYGTGYVDPLSFEYPKLLVIPDKKAKDIVKALQKEFFNGEKDY
jgi:murein DD-endopeptidase MepM/ murein hydrolase activator NlpD